MVRMRRPSTHAARKPTAAISRSEEPSTTRRFGPRPTVLKTSASSSTAANNSWWLSERRGSTEQAKLLHSLSRPIGPPVSVSRASRPQTPAGTQKRAAGRIVQRVDDGGLVVSPRPGGGEEAGGNSVVALVLAPSLRSRKPPSRNRARSRRSSLAARPKTSMNSFDVRERSRGVTTLSEPSAWCSEITKSARIGSLHPSPWPRSA